MNLLSDFPCRFKVNSDKPVLIFRWQKFKTGKKRLKGWWLPLTFSKIYVQQEKKSSTWLANQIWGFRILPAQMLEKKISAYILHLGMEIILDKNLWANLSRECLHFLHVQCNECTDMKKNLKHKKFWPEKRSVVFLAGHLFFNYFDMSFYLFMKECHDTKTSLRLRALSFRARAYIVETLNLSNEENSSVSSACIENLMRSN